MTTSSPLDYETVSYYVLAISATDGGVPPLSGQTFLHLTVSDVNDNAPVFTNHSREVFLPENSPNGSFVIEVSATDEDASSNAAIVYSISQGNEKETFYLDRNSGILSVHALLDFEQTKSYLLRIEAWDMGEPQLSAQTLVIAYIHSFASILLQELPSFSLCAHS